MSSLWWGNKIFTMTFGFRLTCQVPFFLWPPYWILLRFNKVFVVIFSHASHTHIYSFKTLKNSESNDLNKKYERMNLVIVENKT